MSPEVERASNLRARGARSAAQTSAPTEQPLTRRELRERAAANAVAEAALNLAPAANEEIAAVTFDAELVVDAATEFSDANEKAKAVEADASQETADAFAEAARLFAFTGDEPAATPVKISVEHPEDATSEAVAYFGSEPRKARSNFRKIATAGLSLGVMGVIGAFAMTMSMPFMGATAAVSAVQPTATPASTIAPNDIQAFVASSDVQNSTVDRATDYSQVSAAEIAAEDGIIYSSSVFTNDRSAAIQWPFAVGVGMSYGYGMRDGALHEGIDFTPGDGAPIQAIADGTVRIATENGGNYGVTVYIDHIIDGEPITSHYSHMQYGSLRVTEGEHVKVGTVVGLTGNTGRSFGSHLHFELIVNGSTIDPMPWMKEHAG